MNTRASPLSAPPSTSPPALTSVPVFDKGNKIRQHVELPHHFQLQEASNKRDAVIHNYYLHHLTIRGLWHAVSELVDWLQSLDRDEIESLILDTGDVAYAWSLALLLKGRVPIQPSLVDGLRQRAHRTGHSVSQLLERSAYYDSGSLTDWLHAAGEERNLYVGAVKPDIVTRRIDPDKVRANRDFVDVSLSILVYLLVIAHSAGGAYSRRMGSFQHQRTG